MIWLGLYIAAIVAANWAVSTFGKVPVGFGLVASAGVYFAGMTFTFRDLTQEQLGRRGVWAAILAGAVVSVVVAGGHFAFASGFAFLVAETVDWAVYTPLRRRHWLAAVALSNTVGVVADSLLFLWLAFGGIDALAGQVLGKSWMTVAAVLVLAVWRGRYAGRVPVLGRAG